MWLENRRLVVTALCAMGARHRSASPLSRLACDFLWPPHFAPSGLFAAEATQILVPFVSHLAAPERRRGR